MDSTLRLVFLGSPAAVVPVLEWLQRQPSMVVCAVVTQPPRPAGRKQKLTDPPVAVAARQWGVPLLQPSSARDPVFLDALQALAPDVALTCAYGQILDQAFLAIPRLATLNIHPSMLPDLRGASPVQTALWHGYTQLGVSVLHTVRALDAGPVLVQQPFVIGPEECAGELTARLFQASLPLLAEALAKLRQGDGQGVPQDESQVTVCRKFSKEDGLIRWTQSAAEIWNQFRAVTPWPGAFWLEPRGHRVQILKMRPQPQRALSPGELRWDSEWNELLVGTATHSLCLQQLRVAGRGVRTAQEFWNGWTDR